ncbi:MAG: tryptophan--tRNA ligase [Candidatus Latescibacteria bacterium]|nr:tryptophan--tRNA ligase [Candidatus Latescibacterota bacterium]NIM21336.1 tryptophan--tRNA ligase [Candidatus Latescibacterota bacterium]NIM65517.1 tryptophan--tRNA ligase [Candidatus Latescibacterota bacterium]NIO01897.1 tryptophan--tRNA ligase [Candidatus Latescibacterota bacterium]NIO28710.1 tryptophan--tRNA ligase [Candidatus Latescibacterota bacterium]
MSKNKKIILSGNRPTGKLHLGNYTGALENWVALQKEYKCYFMVADWHVLTTDHEHTDEIRRYTREMFLDWIGAGLDPEISTLFIQSQIKEHAELFLLLSMLITKPRLERNPTLKEQVRDLQLDQNVSYGHLGYPVLQAADILMYRADLVPVGEDQMPHVEITREIARKFNQVFGTVFPIPDGKLTQFARFPGLDGNRMSKSLGNTIEISDGHEEIKKKVMTAFTDPARKRRSDPGHPEICLIYTYWQKFGADRTKEIHSACTGAKIGCVECKQQVAAAIAKFFEPLRDKRRALEDTPGAVDEIIDEGNRRARERAQETMKMVREKMKLG